jgi:hypothetical protein
MNKSIEKIIKLLMSISGSFYGEIRVHYQAGKPVRIETISSEKID